MHHKLYRLHANTHRGEYHYHLISEALVLLLVALVAITAPASAAKRLQERSLYINDFRAGATTSYTVSFKYMSPDPIGSIDMLFCIDPIPHHPCVTPTGFNAANAVLSNQSGETGFSILSKSTNNVVLTRTPAAITDASSSYTLDNIVNPTDTSKAFSVRLRTHSSINASGPQVDFGSVRGQINNPIIIETQVPPMLIFCVAGEVAENCTSTNDNYYTDMGQLSSQSTLTAQSQMAVGTNASAGFAITANAAPMSAGTNIINSLANPTESRPGTNQFGINLVANNSPTVGNDPEGPWTNATPTTTYGQPNRYKFVSGDVVASSPNVSLMRKFTVSYIVNSSDDLKAGVYSTTVTYIASGLF